MTLALMAIGLVLVIEGLAFALAPLRIEDALRWLQDMAVERRRGFGLGCKHTTLPMRVYIPVKNGSDGATA